MVRCFRERSASMREKLRVDRLRLSEMSNVCREVSWHRERIMESMMCGMFSLQRKHGGQMAEVMYRGTHELLRGVASRTGREIGCHGTASL